LPSPVEAATPEQAPFDETWRESAVTVALKSAALARIEEPKIVQTETVRVEPAVLPLPDSPEKQPVAKRKLKRHVERDVCRGKGKRYVRVGRLWKRGERYRRTASARSIR
jgi:hypothetical protein